MPQYGKLKIDQFLYNDSGTDVTLDLANLASKGANTFTGNQSLGDNKKVIFGTGGDLEIYHSGTGTYQTNTTGFLFLQSDALALRSVGQENYVVGYANGATELYYDNSKKLQTTSGGIKVTGNDGVTIEGVQDNSADLFFHADGGDDNNDKWYLGAYAGGPFKLLNYASGSWESNIEATGNGAVELYYDNVKKLETTGNGVRIEGLDTVTSVGSPAALQLEGGDADGEFVNLRFTTQASGPLANISGKAVTTGTYPNSVGELIFSVQNANASYEALKITSNRDINIPTDGKKLQLGASQDLQIYHDGSHSFISDTGTGGLKVLASDLYLRNPSDQDMIYATSGGAVKLYYDGSQKLETASDRVNITGHMISTGTVKGTKLSVDDNNKATFGSSDDLQIYHDGSNSRLKNTTGSLWLQSDTGIRFVDADINESMAAFYDNGAVELYYDGSKKLDTTSGGINVTGAITVNGAALAGGGYASVQVFTSSGTWTKPSGIKLIHVVVTGGGGGGRSNYGNVSGGGGGGGTAIETIDVQSVSSVSVTVGAAGNAKTYADNGEAGGNSSFGSYCYGNGGGGGLDWSGGAGGTATGGDINIKGSKGDGYFQNLNNVDGGGGGSIWGKGPGHANIVVNHDMDIYGTGGCGGHRASNIFHRGSNGYQGVVIVYEYK